MTAVETAPAGVVGTRMLRKEDPALLTGEAKYTDDLAIPGALSIALVRSPYAHARIRSVDLSAALGMPGVVAAYSGADLRDAWGPMPCAWAVTPDMKAPEHFPLAIDKVAYVGDAVAVVVARSNAEARDAVDMVVVDYDPLPAVIDLEDALSDRVVIHEGLGTNKSYTWELHPQGQEAVDAAFASAAYTVSERYIQQRLIPMAMEPRAVAAVPQPFGGDITLYSATQIPHILKIMVALTLSIPEHQVRVVAPAVGGGFGSKLNVYAEELICTALARKLRVPVRWVEERTENAQATIQGRGQIQKIDLAADADGKVTAVRVDLVGDMGAYLQLVTPGIPLARRVPVRGRVRRAELLVQLHVGVHDDDADRRLPRRRTSRGHLRDRAGDGRARGEGRRRSSRAPPSQHDQGIAVPVHRDDGSAVRQRQPRGRARPRRSSCATTTAAEPSRRAAGRPARRSTSGSASRRTSRCAGSLRAACSPR